LYEEALNVGRAALGMHAEVASILNKMGNLYYERGGDFLDAALERYQQGLEVETAVLHDLHPNITVTLTNIGQIHKQRGEFPAALQL
jgi:tetratricopeptide (TPR) repeat protein